MEPRIQFAQTKDGVSIAYWTLGQGMPFVSMTHGPFGHIQMEWQFPEHRRWYQRLAEKRRLVRYDGRGCGLSQREAADYSLDALVTDLEAVVDGLDTDRVVLFALMNMGPVAIAYAARHPGRVSHLILWCSFARAPDYLTSPQAPVLQLMETDWELFTETIAHDALGWAEGGPAHRFATLIREATTPQTMQASFAAWRNFDVTALLPLVKVRSLVLHRRHLRYITMEHARELASCLPDALLVLLEGNSVGPYLGDMEAVISAIDEFLGDGEKTAAAFEAPEPGAFRTILFTDVEGSTALTQRLGDARARELLREHERTVREALKAHGGSEVKTMGDGFMASFSSATKALECAIAMQRAFAALNESADEPIKVRVGLNAGEPIAEDDDLFGTAVNEAARITAAAKGGEILVGDVVRQLTKGKDFLFADRGEMSLKGFDESVRLFEVRWAEGE